MPTIRRRKKGDKPFLYLTRADVLRACKSTRAAKLIKCLKSCQRSLLWIRQSRSK